VIWAEVIVFSGVLCTNVAVSVFRILFSIMLLKRGPEDLPASLSLLQALVLLNALTGIVVLGMRYDEGLALALTLLDLVLTLGFTWILLKALNHPLRFVQTAAALCGVDTLYCLLLWPLLLPATGGNTSQAGSALVLLQLALYAWELPVIAHIFRRAIESSMSSAIALSFALFIISTSISQLLFFSGAQ